MNWRRVALGFWVTDILLGAGGVILAIVSPTIAATVLTVAVINGIVFVVSVSCISTFVRMRQRMIRGRNQE